MFAAISTTMLVEALLRGDRLRHDLAEPLQKQARTAGSAIACVSRTSVRLRPGRPGNAWAARARPCRQAQDALSSPYSECSVRTASSV